MKRIRSILSGTGVGNDIGLTVVAHGIGAVVAYATMITVTRLLGPEVFDQYALAQVYVSAGAAVLDFGIVAVAYPRLAVGDPIAAPSLTMSYLLRIVMIPVALGSVFLFAAGTGVLSLFPAIAVGLAVALVSGKFTGLRQVSEMVWRVRGRTWMIATIALFDALLFLLLLRTVGRSIELGPVEVFGLLLLANVPGFLMISIPVVRRLLRKRKSEPTPRIRRNHAEMILLGALPIGLMGITAQLFGRIEPLVINSTIGLQDVGDYTVAVSPLVGTLFIPMTIAVGLVPLIAQAQAGRRSDVAISGLYASGTRVLIGVGLLIGVGSAIFAEPILSLFGPDYLDDAWILRLYGITNILEYLVIFLDQGFIAVGKRKEVMIGTFLGLALAVALQVGLVPFLALTGILLGKIGALLGKLSYQFSRLDPEARRGLLKGLARGVPALIAVAALYLVTSDFDLLLRAAIVVPVAIAILMLSRTLDLAEIERLRRMRIS